MFTDANPYMWAAFTWFLVGAFYGRLPFKPKDTWTWVWFGIAALNLFADYLQFG